MIAPTYSFIESDFSSVDEALSAYGARRYEPTPATHSGAPSGAWSASDASPSAPSTLAAAA